MFDMCVPGLTLISVISINFSIWDFLAEKMIMVITDVIFIDYSYLNYTIFHLLSKVNIAYYYKRFTVEIYYLDILGRIYDLSVDRESKISYSTFCLRHLQLINFNSYHTWSTECICIFFHDALMAHWYVIIQWN